MLPKVCVLTRGVHLTGGPSIRISN